MDVSRVEIGPPGMVTAGDGTPLLVGTVEISILDRRSPGRTQRLTVSVSLPLAGHGSYQDQQLALLTRALNVVSAASTLEPNLAMALHYAGDGNQ